jgi:hypothetical protein
MEDDAEERGCTSLRIFMYSPVRSTHRSLMKFSSRISLQAADLAYWRFHTRVEGGLLYGPGVQLGKEVIRTSFS